MVSSSATSSGSTRNVALVQSLGAAAGYIGVLVFALYINSPESLELYTNPKLLWLLCPILLYWISRISTTRASSGPRRGCSRRTS